MPRLSCWFVRASLIYLAIGFTFGALMLANEGLGFDPLLGLLLPAHMEMLLVGWLVQLAMGVAFWILPRFPQGPPRGNETLAWLAFVLLNLGIALVVIEAFLAVPWLVWAGRLGEMAGVAAFAASAWPRVRPFAAV